MDSAPTLRPLLLERERLTARLTELGSLIDAALADPDADLAGVKVTERKDIRVSVRDKDALDRHLFATGRHKYVVSTIRLPGCTEQDLYDALAHVHGVVGAYRGDGGPVGERWQPEGGDPPDEARRGGGTAGRGGNADRDT